MHINEWRICGALEYFVPEVAEEKFILGCEVSVEALYFFFFFLDALEGSQSDSDQLYP